MKPFDIELAKQGHPVQTSDGRPVRILCYDRTDKDFPIIALVPDNNLKANVLRECVYDFTVEGKFYNTSSSPEDLFMAPTKKEGWMNLYRKDGKIEAGLVYDSEEEAISSIAYKDPSYVTTVKIEWRE